MVSNISTIFSAKNPDFTSSDSDSDVMSSDTSSSEDSSNDEDEDREERQRRKKAKVDERNPVNALIGDPKNANEANAFNSVNKLQRKKLRRERRAQNRYNKMNHTSTLLLGDGLFGDTLRDRSLLGDRLVGALLLLSAGVVSFSASRTDVSRFLRSSAFCFLL